MRGFTMQALAIAAIVGAVTFPPPTNGTYGTDISPFELIDHNRTDPYDPQHGPRKLMVSVIHPTVPANRCNFTTYPFAPPKSTEYLNSLAVLYGFPNGSQPLDNLSLSICPVKGHGWGKDFAIVLFSHGSGASRLLSTSQAQSVAAQGFIVVTIDHPYNAAVVEYPDSSVIEGITFSNNTVLDEDVRLRSQDASFVIDQLSDPKSPLRKAIPGCSEKVAMFGHSLGGTSSARAAYDDERVFGALNLDGYPYGWNTTGNFSNPQFTLPELGEKPFLLFNAEPSVDVLPYVQMLDAFSGWKKQISLADSQHLAFTDLPLAADLTGTRTAALELYIGTIDGLRARDAVAAYVGAFMDLVLKDEEVELLEGPSDQWPEVEFVREG